jgi:putative DNA primase/helicase
VSDHHGVTLAERARGKWRSILPAVGIGPSFLTGKNGPCPVCGGKDRWRFINRNGTGDWFCNVCDPQHGSGVQLVMAFHKIDFAQAATKIEQLIGEAPVERDKPKADSAWVRTMMRDLWQRAAPIEPGDPAERYLVSRGLSPAGDFWSSSLRYIEDCPYDKETRLPAMIAKVVAPDGKPVNIHRTFITLQGRKTEREPAKKLMRGTCPPGSAIRLGPRVGTLGIAEGIENALAAQLLFRVPVWSVISAQGMERFQKPEGLRRLIIFGDNDRSFTGQAAAYALAKRARLQWEIEADVRIPTHPGTDWNDQFHVEPEMRFGE